MNTTPTKRSRRYARGALRSDDENRPPNDAAAANVAAVAAMVDLTGIPSSSDDESDNEDHLDCKPKAKKKECQKTATATATADDDSVIDLTRPPTKPPTTTAAPYDSDDDTDDDDDDVFCVVDPPSAAATAATMVETITSTTLATTTKASSTTRRNSHYSSPRRRRRRCGRDSIDSLGYDVDDENAASLALARQLQEQYGMALQQQRQEQKSRDEQEAWRLQKEFDAQDKKQKRLLDAKRQQDEEQMSASVTGRAWKFVEKVLALDESLKQKYSTAAASAATRATLTSSNKVSAIAKDDMVFLCEQMLRQQEAFRNAGKPVKVDLGFHYTRPDNVSRIRTDGLLSKAEREGRSITSAYHGSSYGDGIYTSDDHSLGGCSGCYGDIGIIVARLKGTEKLNSCDFSGNHDCNQSSAHAVTVLKTSAQCLALVEFHRSVLFPTTAAAATASAPRVMFGPAMHATAPHGLPASLQALFASHSTQLPGPAAAAAFHAAVASAAAHRHHPVPLPYPIPSLTIPAVNSGIVGEYRRELQKIVDETFDNKKS